MTIDHTSHAIDIISPVHAKGVSEVWRFHVHKTDDVNSTR